MLGPVVISIPSVTPPPPFQITEWDPAGTLSGAIFDIDGNPAVASVTYNGSFPQVRTNNSGSTKLYFELEYQGIDPFYGGIAAVNNFGTDGVYMDVVGSIAFLYNYVSVIDGYDNNIDIYDGPEVHELGDTGPNFTGLTFESGDYLQFAVDNSTGTMMVARNNGPWSLEVPIVWLGPGVEWYISFGCPISSGNPLQLRVRTNTDTFLGTIPSGYDPFDSPPG